MKNKLVFIILTLLVTMFCAASLTYMRIDITARKSICFLSAEFMGASILGMWVASLAERLEAKKEDRHQ